MKPKQLNTDAMIPQGSYTRIAYERGLRMTPRDIPWSMFWDTTHASDSINTLYNIEECWIARKLETVEIHIPMITAKFPTTESNRELYHYTGMVNYRRHAAVVMEREGFEMPEAIALAMELPVQCFIAGGFVAAYINEVKPERFDVYFTGEAAFIETLKRLQNAPEGSFMHGYTQHMTATAMLAANESFLEFCHPEKPTILLVRTRWYSKAEYLVDSLDLSCEQVALGSDLHLTFTASAIQDAKDKLLKLHRTNWQVNTAVDVPKYQARGYRAVGSERHSEQFPANLASQLKSYAHYNGHNPRPFTSF